MTVEQQILALCYVSVALIRKIAKRTRKLTFNCSHWRTQVMFHLQPDRNFRNFLVNGKRPKFLSLLIELSVNSRLDSIILTNIDPSSAKDWDNEAKANGRTRRGHYGNYFSQPNAKIPKTTMYRILNTLKSEETNEETSSAMNEKLNDDVCLPPQKEFNDVFNNPVPLSSFGNDNAEIFDVNGYTCSQRSGLPGSEMHVSVLSTSSPPSLSAELHQPTDPEETSRQLTNEASIIDDVGPWHFPDSDDPAIDMEQRPMNFVSSEADEEEYSVNDI